MRSDGKSDASTAVPSPRRDGQARGVLPALTIVSHPSAERAGERFVLAAPEVALTRNEPDFVRADRVLGAPLGDPFVSRRPIRLLSAAGSVTLFAAGGTPLLVGGEPVPDGLTFAPEALARGLALELAGRVVLLLHAVEPEPEPGAELLGMVGRSAALQQVRVHIARVADLHVPVLVRGETGTGKELVARALHERGPRRDGPFVSVNLGAIPRDLAAAELFGAQRGAYTGAAQDRPGFFRAARGGTLFLDEIGEASPEVQVMLLRVLETGEMYPVGAAAPVATDVRLIAATDADLEQQILEGRFKAPLLHRLAGYEIRVPPLRERREDLGVLFLHFAREELRAIGEVARLAPRDPRAEPWLPASLASALVRAPWPGNVRQLRNVVRQLVIGSRGQGQLSIDPRLSAELVGPPSSAPVSPPARARRKPSEVSEGELREALAGCGWDLQAAAERLGIPRPSVYDLIQRFPGIRTAGDLGAEDIAACHLECDGDLEAMAAHLQVSARALKRRVKELGLGGRRG